MWLLLDKTMMTRPRCNIDPLEAGFLNCMLRSRCNRADRATASPTVEITQICASDMPFHNWISQLSAGLEWSG